MDHVDFIVEDYKLALSYLQGQFQRLWQRFGFFLTVQLALFGVIGAVVFERGKLSAIPLVSAIGVVVSVLWYVVAAEDRYLVDVYRTRVQQAAERIGRAQKLVFKDYEKVYVGIEAQSGCSSPLEWYWQPVSITRLPAWLAILLGAVWIGMMLNGKDWLTPFLPPVSAK
jgi:hypothetical protein